MIIEEIDLLYVESVKSRNEKSIKDELQINPTLNQLWREFMQRSLRK